MNVGGKINEFDNSPGTLADFNRIFPNNPLTIAAENIEILHIPGKNEFERILRLDNAMKVTHNFYPKKKRN